MFTKYSRKALAIAVFTLTALLIGGTATVAGAFSVDVKKLYYVDYMNPTTTRRVINYDFSGGSANGNTITIPTGSNGVVQTPFQETPPLTYTFGPYPDPSNDLSVTLDTGAAKATLTFATDGGMIINTTSPPNTPPVPQWVYAATLTNFTGMTDGTKEYKAQIGFGSMTSGPHPEFTAAWIPATGGGRTLVLNAQIYDDTGAGTTVWGPVTAPINGFDPATGVIVLRIRCLDPNAGGNSMVFDYSVDGEQSWSVVGTDAFGFPAFQPPLGFPHASFPAKFPFVSLWTDSNTQMDPFQVYSVHENGTDGNKYYANVFVNDPGQAVYDNISVTGSGCVTLASTALTYGGGQWKLSSPVTLSQDNPPASCTQTFAFNAVKTAGGAADTPSSAITGYVVDFASNLLPTGNVSTTPVFSWTGFSGVDSYNVWVGDLNHNMIWDSNNVPSTQTSITYGGPALTSGQTYHYHVNSVIDTAGSSNHSIASTEFTYTGSGGATISFSGWVKTTPNWPLIEGMAPVSGATVSAYLPGTTPTLINTATADSGTGAFTLTGIPSSTTFYLLVQPPSGYVPVLSKFMNWQAPLQALLPFGIATQTQYETLANQTGTGIILGRVALRDGPATFLSGATVVATEWMNGAPTGTTYPVTYTGGGAVTGADGVYMVKNVPAGTMVQLVAMLAGHTFEFNGAVVPVQTGFISEESFFGTPVQIPFYAHSYHQDAASGYFIFIFADDPTHAFTGVTVSGPGLASEGVAMTYNTGNGRWETPDVPLGTTLPTGSRTYDFTAATGGTPVTGSRTVSVYVEGFASALLPTGDVTVTPVFSWTGITGATSYSVILDDLTANHGLWSSPTLVPDKSSILYNGPALTTGHTYRYTVISSINTDGNSNSSFAWAQFTYTGGGSGTITVSGIVRDWTGNVVPSPGVTVTLVGDDTKTTTSSATDGSFSLSGVPANTPFSLKFSAAGYLDLYSSNVSSGGDINLNVSSTGSVPFTMPTGADLTAFGAMPDAGKGLIAGRAVDATYRYSATVGGVVVTATGNGGKVYPVFYRDPFGALVQGGTTFGNGRYYVLNVDGGDTVTLSASKNGWVFSPPTYNTHADGVSMGRIYGMTSGYVAMSGSVVDSAGGAIADARLELNGDNGKFTIAGTDGSYTFSGLPRDAYFYVKGTAPGYVPTYAGPIRLSASMSGSIISLLTPAQMSGSGVIGSNGMLTCKVIDSSMTPLSGATVLLTSKKQASYNVVYTGGGSATDPTGNIMVPDIQPGDTVKIEVTKEGYTFAPLYLDGFAGAKTSSYIRGADQSAGPFVFTSEADFNAAVLPTKMVNFEDQNVAGGRIGLTGNEYAGLGITFSTPNSQPLWVYPSNWYWNSKHLSPGEAPYESGDGDADSLTLTFTSPVTAIGWTFVDFGGVANEGIRVYAADNTLIYENSNLSAIGGTGAGQGNNPFWGISSPGKPIARVEIVEAANDGDDIAYDNFRFSTVGQSVGTTTVSGAVKDSSATPVGIDGVAVEQVGAPTPNATVSSGGGFYTLPVPSAIPFQLKFSKSGFTPSFTSRINVSGPSAMIGDMTLFPDGQLATWGVQSGYGALRGRVTDQAQGNIGGATVRAFSRVHSSDTYYQVCYNNDCTPGLTATDPVSGRYMVVNVEPGDTVTVTAQKNGWVFNERVFDVHADAFHLGGMQGMPNSACTYAVTFPPGPFASSGAATPHVATVAAAGNCLWGASTPDGWIHIPLAGGNGSGSVSFTLDDNAGPGRTGTIMIAGQAFVVNQTGAAASTNNLLQNGGFTTGLAGWAVNPALGGWNPLLGDGTVSLHPTSYGFMGTILYQNLNIAGVAGKTFNLWMNLTNISAPPGNTVAAYMTYVDGSGNYNRLRISLVPGNEGITTNTTVSGSLTIPAGAVKIVKIEIAKEDYGEFHADDIVLSADGLTAGLTPVVSGLSAPSGTYGTPLTINGQNFGTVPGSVRIGGQPVAVTAWTENSITVNVQAPARSGSVVVVAGWVESNADQSFQVMSPYFTVDVLNPGLKVIQGQTAEFTLKSEFHNGFDGNVGLQLVEKGTAYLAGKWTFLPLPIRGNGGVVLKIDTANLGAGTYAADIQTDGGIICGSIILKVVTVSEIKFFESVYNPATMTSTKNYLTSLNVTKQGQIPFVNNEVYVSDGTVMAGAPLTFTSGNPGLIAIYRNSYGTFDLYAEGGNGTAAVNVTAPDGYTGTITANINIPDTPKVISVGLAPSSVTNAHADAIAFSAQGTQAIGYGMMGMLSTKESTIDWIDQASTTVGGSFKLDLTTPPALGTYLYYAGTYDAYTSQTSQKMAPLTITNDPSYSLIKGGVRSLDPSVVFFMMEHFTLEFYSEVGVKQFSREYSSYTHGEPNFELGAINPGIYKIQFVPMASSLKSQWWPNATDISGAASVTFTAGKTTGDIYFFAMPQPAGAVITLPTNAQTIAPAGGTGSVSVTAGPGVSWSAGSDAPWITITSGLSGVGNGAVNFSVTANPLTDPRTGTITIGGQTFTVTQPGSGGSQPLPPYVGTWGVQVLSHFESNVSSWYAEASKVTFNLDGTGSLTTTGNESGNVASDAATPFNYTIFPNPDGSFVLTVTTADKVDTMRMVLSDDQQMAVFDGTAAASQQKLMVIVKLDTAGTYTAGDVSGEYYYVGYEHNVTGVQDPPNGNGNAMAIAGIQIFNGAGSYTYTGKANSLYLDGHSAVWDDSGSGAYNVGTDGSFTGGGGAFLGYMNQSAAFIAGGGAFVPGANNQAGYLLMKKGDRTYGTGDLAGKWALASFGDDTQVGQTQSVASSFGTMICDANGVCQYSSRNRRTGNADYTYESGSVQIAVSPDGSFGASLPVGAGSPQPPAYAGAIGNNGNTLIFNTSFDAAQVGHRQLFIGVRASTIGDLAAVPAISFLGFVEDQAGAGVDQALVEQVGAAEHSTMSTPDGAFMLGNLPAGQSFHLKMSKDGYTPTYSSQVNSKVNVVNPRDRAFTLFPAGQLATWGVVDTDKGIIRSRLRDSDGIAIGGVVVTATGLLQASYPVCYEDTCSANQASTYGPNGAAPGRYIVKNVLDGDTVTVTAHKNGWFFGQRVFKTHAGGVSQGRIDGMRLIVKGDLTGEGNVDLKDAILALRINVGLPADGVRPDLATAMVDANGDGFVGMQDVPLILQKSAGLRSSLETGRGVTLVSHGHPPVGFNFVTGQVAEGFGAGDFQITGGDTGKAYGWLNGATMLDLGAASIATITTAPESSQYGVPEGMYLAAGRSYAFKLASGTFALLEVKSVTAIFGAETVVTMVFDYKYQGNGTRNFQ